MIYIVLRQMLSTITIYLFFALIKASHLAENV